MCLLLRRHRIPDPVMLLVSPLVVHFRSWVENTEVYAGNRDENAVALTI
jgi:hypothetical protein